MRAIDLRSHSSRRLDRILKAAPGRVLCYLRGKWYLGYEQVMLPRTFSPAGEDNVDEILDLYNRGYDCWLSGGIGPGPIIRELFEKKEVHTLAYIPFLDGMTMAYIETAAILSAQFIRRKK